MFWYRDMLVQSPIMTNFAGSGNSGSSERRNPLPPRKQFNSVAQRLFGSELVRQDGDSTGTSQQAQNPFGNIWVKQNTD